VKINNFKILQPSIHPSISMLYDRGHYYASSEKVLNLLIKTQVKKKQKQVTAYVIIYVA